MLEEKIKSAVRDVLDFPKEGIVFKDITPILKDTELCSEILDELVSKLSKTKIDVIAGVESRGFFFGLMLACRLGVPFVPLRKLGKLPYKTIKQEYRLEYGSTSIEMHEDAIERGQHVLIHDDLLATGGTMEAASRLIERQGGIIAGYAFLISLEFLNGKEKLLPFSGSITILAEY